MPTHDSVLMPISAVINKMVLVEGKLEAWTSP
jgi:hypothetical protein